MTKVFYAVSIRYTTADNRTAVYRIKNLTPEKLKEFRLNVYSAGLYIPSEDCPATEGTIVSPYQVGNIDVVMQEKKFT